MARESHPWAPMVTTAERFRRRGVAEVDRVWSVPSLRPAPPEAHAPSLNDLTAIARASATEISFDRAALRLQREACKLVKATEALCVVFDWPRRAAWTLAGRVRSEQVMELIAQVAGSGRRSVIGNALIEPIGPAPARAVLALRKPTAATFSVSEIAIITALVNGLAPSIDRLMNQR